MKKFFSENWFKMGILIILGLAIIFTGYYYLVASPRIEEQKIDTQAQQSVIKYDQSQTEQQKNIDAINQQQEAIKQNQAQQQTKLQNCINKVSSDNQALWDSGKLGYTLQQQRDLKNDCYKLYPVN